MLGAIYGDKSGSIYEFKQLTKIESIKPAKLITEESFYSDDTIETIAVIDAITNKKDYLDTLKKYILSNLEYKPFNKFNTTTNETLNNCLYAFYISNSFEDAIRKTLLMGGDTDTNAALVGSMAEALYKMNDTQKKDALKGLPNEYKKS